MINLLIYVVILCLVFGVVFYLIDMLPLPPPFNVVARVVLILILLLILLDLLLGGRFVGMPRLASL